MLQEKNRATLVGLLAPVCWGMSVGLIRSLEEVFGMAQGLTICYVIGMLFTLFVFGIPLSVQVLEEVSLPRGSAFCYLLTLLHILAFSFLLAAGKLLKSAW